MGGMGKAEPSADEPFIIQLVVKSSALAKYRLEHDLSHYSLLQQGTSLLTEGAVLKPKGKERHTHR